MSGSTGRRVFLCTASRLSRSAVADAFELVGPFRCVVVTGPRDWSDRAALVASLVRIPRDVILVEGGASGADRLACSVALQLGFRLVEAPAEWQKRRVQGDPAGHRRNRAMLALAPVGVLACVPRGGIRSPGTAGCVAEARRLGIPVWACHQSDPDPFAELAVRQAKLRRELLQESYRRSGALVIRGTHVAHASTTTRKAPDHLTHPRFCGCEPCQERESELSRRHCRPGCTCPHCSWLEDRSTWARGDEDYPRDDPERLLQQWDGRVHQLLCSIVVGSIVNVLWQRSLLIKQQSANMQARVAAMRKQLNARELLAA